MSFHVGQKVVCINNEGNPYLTLGMGYTVASLYHFNSGPSGIFLREQTQSDHLGTVNGLCAFYASRFRPVVETKTDISIFTRMLTPIQKREKV